ncbi:DUF1800 family protein [Aquimonas sp.]|jgi:uncharacterized protein (DUF1800 family)|uniref:DUF1800 domain-containing protein n=1 Tax=Aquimonas sp. TaxID=1872588 RepID=UPI0037C15CA3
MAAYRVLLRLRRILALALFGLAMALPAQAQRIFASGFEPYAPETDAEAARFLTQASFGPTVADIARLRQIGYQAWLDEQFSRTPSLQVPYLDFVAGIPEPLYQNARMEAWFGNAITAPDQLRQRVAYALSQILVVSDANGPLEIEPRAVSVYCDLLSAGAFGNYRTLLGHITRSPAMGSYLSMRGNRRPDVALNIRPDENFAREILQLFTIGLVQLNADGSPALVSGQPVPSYNQRNIKTFAHVFTGWNFGNCNSFDFCSPGWPEAVGWTLPMQPFASFHHTEPDADPDNNEFLSGVLRPAGGTPNSNLDAALDNIFNHPNVGPFLARRLIQQLVTSNPSPAYIGRMTAVFNNNGQGVRGDLQALIGAILMDPEARTGHLTQPTRFGKVREPILRQTQLWRAFGARAQNNRYADWNPESHFNQAPNRSPSVFNFYLPDYQRPGELASLGMYSPELQIVNEVFVTRTANWLYNQAERHYLGSQFNPNPDARTVMMEFNNLWSLANSPAALIDHLNVLLMGGQMSAHMRGVVLAYIEGIPYTAFNDPGGRQRSWEAVHLIVTSPEYQVQK